MKIVGIDPSLTGTGLAAIVDGRLTGTDVIRPPAWQKRAPRTEQERQMRLDVILGVIGEWARLADLTVIEGLSFDHHDSDRQLSGLNWIIRRQLWAGRRPFVLVPPSNLKLWAVGHGRAPKGVMLAAARETFPEIEIEDDNAADATWLAALGSDHLGEPAAQVPADRVRALGSVAWPALADAA